MLLAAGIESNADGEGLFNPADSEIFWRYYQFNKSEGDASALAVLDDLLLRYSLNHWLSIPFLISENLLGYIQHWMLRVASLRLLILGDKDWQQQSRRPEGQLKPYMAKRFQQFGRGIESRSAYVTEVLEHYETEDALTAVAQTLLFLKI
jgi:hypothetical protein